MKKITLVLLFLVVSIAATAGTLQQKHSAVIALKNVAVPASCEPAGVDEYYDLEAASLPTGWAETDTATMLDFQDSTDSKCSASNSMSIDIDSSADAFISYNMGEEKVTASTGFWWKAPTITAETMDLMISGLGGGAYASANVIVFFRKQAGPTYRLYLYGWAFSTNYYTVTSGNWYYVAYKNTEGAADGNSAGSMYLFDSNGDAVNHNGSAAELTLTGKDGGTQQYFSYGFYYTANDSGSNKMFIDDISIDTTGATHPLGP